eukprot:TRINITY_DN30896_c0_g1_i1.p1 TRINITY_DN30896_c0_g1~~TRINITY_DN30896_c0_g1_i1.p1  ORF type:complete len:392 (+),score=116.03 TRINITY_DN30896_c0_g1_i1:103-1176(+)
MCIRDRYQRRVHGEYNENLSLRRRLEKENLKKMLIDATNIGAKGQPFIDMPENEQVFHSAREALFPSDKAPWQEGVLSALKNALVPFLKWNSVILWISIIDFIVFGLEIYFCKVETVPMDFAMIHSETCMAMGPLYAWGIKHNYEFYRLLTLVFLHAAVIHITGNVFMQMIAGPYLEHFTGPANFLLVYLGSGIGASIISVPFMDLAVGASGADFGLGGALLAMYMILGDRLKEMPTMLGRMKLLAAMFTAQFLGEVASQLFMSSSIGGLKVGHAAHIGGFISGFLIAYFVLSKKYGNPTQKKHGRIAILCCLLLLAVIMLCFMLFSNPKTLEELLKEAEEAEKRAKRGLLPQVFAQ